jgi:hypothetical protein
MDETALSKIVNGFREPSGELRERVAAVLESDEQWLFERVKPVPATDATPRAPRAASK